MLLFYVKEGTRRFLCCRCQRYDLEYGCYDFIHNLIKIGLPDYAKLANDIALRVTGDNLTFHITRFPEIAGTHSFFERITVLRIDVRFECYQNHIDESLFVLLQCVIGNNNSRMHFCLSVREQEIHLHYISLLISHIRYILQ